MSLEPVLIDGEWRQAEHPAGEFSAVDPGHQGRVRRDVSGLELRRRRAGLPGGGGGRGGVARRRRRSASRASSRTTRRGSKPRARRWSTIAARETGAARESAPRPGGTAPDHQPAPPGGGGGHETVRGATPPSTPRPTSARSTGRWAEPVVVFGPNNFPFAFNSDRRRRFRRGHRGGESGHRQGEHRPPRHQQDARRTGVRRGRGDGPASGDGAAHLPHAARRRAPARLAPGDRRPRGSPAARAPGLRLKDAADKAGKPIYLEMSSANPVFILPGALAERLPAIAQELYDSCSLGAGQFCTRPGHHGRPGGRAGRGLPGRGGRRCSARRRRARCSARRGPSPIAEGIAELVAHGADDRRRRPRGRRAALLLRQHAAARIGRRLPRPSARAADGGLRHRQPRHRRRRTRIR